MINITVYRRGGNRVVIVDGIYYIIISRHLSKKVAQSKDTKYDKCDKIVKKGTWWFRLQKLPQDDVNKIKKMSS